MAIALAALVVAAAGSATAASRQLFTGADVKNASLTGADVKNSSLTGTDVRNGSIGVRDLAPSARTVVGASGSAGPQGPPGPAGLAAVAPSTPLASIGGDTQAIPNGTDTEIDLTETTVGIVSEDPDGMHDNVVNPARLTPRSPGFYTLQVTVAWTANATGDRELRVLHRFANGSISSPVARQSADASALVQSAGFLLRIDPGDSVAVTARQTSGASLNLNPINVSIVRSAPLR
jgi:hypothetical protein